MRKLRVGSDLDDTLNVWYLEYIKKFGKPKSDFEITKNCHNKLKKDRKFWINLPVLHKADFNIHLYCTKRTSSKEYAKIWLNNNGFNSAPIYQCFYQHGSKAPLIKGRCDVFVDDSPENFIDLNRKGIPCLLMDGPHNQDLGPMLRIHSMCYDEIEEVYYLAKEFNIFNNFNLYYDL